MLHFFFPLENLIPLPCRQLQENYKRQNGDGLSVTFLIIWLAGDIFNLAGIIMERLMFTMVTKHMTCIEKATIDSFPVGTFY